MLSPIILIVAAGFLYKKYGGSQALDGTFKMVEIAVFAMIVVVAFNLIGLKNLAEPKTVVFALFFGTLFFWGKLHSVYIIVGAGVLGAFIK
jgi:chromate transport protein ChrA